MERKEISKAVIQRLPRYYRYLEDLMDQGIERISSGDLSRRMHLTASQIRQDLNNFGGFGQQGYGYNVFNLHEEIAKILKIDQVHSMIIVGAGHLGLALSNYTNFRKRGFDIKGVFDNNPKVIGQEAGGVKVSPMSEMKDIVEKNHIRLAALCIPKDAAVKIVDDLISYGVSGFWNFAHVDLEVPEHVVVENVHLSESLMRLSYRVFEEQ
ncbi:redox-sensing transcriptional repressor Rex [Oribacterium sp. oral taxon 108]|uniref:redox-sensing transcriptional repressor Rex n=1 Tax=Oribacterium sp. oral taxon 108 TaxID=712414 RepID=UPI00020DD6D8|nr:redox-sensing transcriptional repressor Rex [Oribacterium sp. oral taxon 108]EGL36075.1 putative redox-sensing transcriptional repressor Rex [Oribacterium sp. oral taxon 108 str. F0425]